MKRWKGAIALLLLGLVLGGCTDANEFISGEAELETSQITSQITSDTEESSEEGKTQSGEIIAEDSLTAEAAQLFDAIEGWEFSFLSGAGGWETTMEVNSEGTFSGRYYDNDMGDIGEGYPNGTRYESDFSGKLTDVKRISQYVYEATVTDLAYLKDPEQIEIVDGVRKVYSTAYGIAGTEKVRIYLPGAAVADLPREYMEWIEPLYFGAYAFDSFYRVFPEELPFCGIYNIDQKEGFSSENREGKNSVYLVNKASFPGLASVRRDLYGDGTYFFEDANPQGYYGILNLCYRSEEGFSVYDRQEKLVDDVISHVMEGRAYHDVYFLDNNDLQYSPEMAYINGFRTLYVFWETGNGEDLREYYARVAILGNYVYVFAYNVSEHDEIMRGEAGYFYLTSLTFSADPSRISSENPETCSRVIYACVINNGTDPQNVKADECLWINSDDEEMMAKYHLKPEEMPNDYAIVEVDGNYADHRMTERCPVYVQYPDEGVFFTLMTKERFHQKMVNSSEPFLMVLYLDGNGNVTFMYEPFRP